MISREFNLYLHAGHSIPLVINANQYDHGEQWLFTLFNADGTQYVPSSGAIVGIKSDNLGIINSGSVDSQGRVVINETQQMTAAVGKAVFELVIDDGTHGTANFVVLVEPKPGDNADLSETDISMIEQAIEAASTIKPYGSPLVASTVAGMTDHDKVYVYVGSETGYTSGHWYYYDGSDWTDGGVYNSVAVQTDTTLTLSGVAADAKKTGDEISELKSQISSKTGLSEEFKMALKDFMDHVAFENDDPNGQHYIDAVVDAMYPPTNLTRISAVYTQSGTVYNTDTLNSLKPDLVVTAHYDDASSEVISNYALSGQLTVGTSQITVSYNNKTDTFNVTVTENPVPAEYTRVEYVERPSGTGDASGYNTLGVTLNGTDDVEIRMGVMATANQRSSSGGYFLGCRMNNTANSIGFGILTDQNTTYLGCWDGTLCTIEPESGSSIANKKYDLVVTKRSTGMTITDGTHSNSVESTPRTMYGEVHVFGVKKYNPTSSSALTVPSIGRIYYLSLTEGGTEKANLIPCKRKSDNAVGFYDTVQEVFRTDGSYVAGAEVA